MCGIAGFIDKTNKLEKTQGLKDLKRMVGAIKHRGKDDFGYFNEANVYLGQTRLSIIDLSASGHQPMIDGVNKIIFNGEIYNFEEIKKQIKNKKFRTKTDTEVILKSYQTFGLEKSLTKFKGMFAFVLLDSKQQLLHLATDRFAIKPLYYFENKNIFAFASEIKALLQLPEVKATFNQDALAEYLYFRHLAGKNTLFKNIYKMPPAQSVSFNLKTGRRIEKTYWSLKKKKNSRPNYQKELVKILQKSIKDHLVADAPIGLQLSGGVDSSLVASFASEIKKKDFHSFSIGLKDSAWNEFTYSRSVAKKIKTIHHEYLFNEQDFCKLLPKVAYHLDEPVEHSHSVPMYILAHQARKYVKILLSGEGADEVFGGYKRYQKVNSLNNDREIMMLTRFGEPTTIKRIIKTKVKEKFPVREAILKTNSKLDNFDKLSVLDQKTYLISMLIRQDKMGMAANLENRVPYLDHELVEFAFSLPLKEKIQGQETKLILKKLASAYIPHECIWRPKVGFGQPIAQWLKNPNGLGRYFKLFENRKRKFINYQELKRVIKEHQANQADHSQTLWILINLELWFRIFLDQEPYQKIWSSLK